MSFFKEPLLVSVRFRHDKAGIISKILWKVGPNGKTLFNIMIIGGTHSNKQY